MSEINILTAQRDEVLAKIQEIEETCEGIENENNAKKLTSLNMQQANLSAQRNDLQVRLSAIERDLNKINEEIHNLSGTGLDKILNAIKNQRWFFFKNKPEVLMDKMTGILWANLDYFKWKKSTNGNYTHEDVAMILKKLSIDGFSEWKLAKFDDFKLMISDKTFPFRQGNNYYIKGERYWYCDMSGDGQAGIDLSDLSKAWDYYYILPCCYMLTNKTYSQNVSQNNKVYTEIERLQFTLNLFVDNGLEPIFTDVAITELYQKIYFEKPVLLEQLQELQTQIDSLQTVTLLSSEFDYTALLAKYDVKAIDNSIIKYYRAVQQWTDELMDKLDYYEQEKESVIRDFNIIGLKLSKKYEQNTNLTAEENELLESRQRYFQKKFSLGMSSVKSKILAVKKQADDLEYRIDEIDNSDDAMYALAVLEQEQRASFTFVAENTAKIIRNALLKIEYFESHHQFVMNAIEIWEKWTEDYRVFKTTYKEDLKASCEEDSIEEDVWVRWYENWRNIRLAIEHKVQPIIERGLRSELQTINDTKISVAEQIIAVLENYKNSIDKFFLEDRKCIYQKFVFQSGGELQEKFESESELYKCTFALQTALQEIIFSCKNAEDRVFILKWANSLLDIQIDEILDFVANNDLQNISQTILTEFATLKQKNYDAYLTDAKVYSEEKSRREKQYNSLIFKMRKDLMKV